MTTAQHLKNLRLNHNYTQSFIADIIGVSQKTYSNIESGKSKVSFTALEALGKVYNMDTVKLIEEISRLEIEIIKEKLTSHPALNHSELISDFNSDLHLELMNQLKSRIADLNRLVDSKNLRIKTLQNRIKILENK